MRRLVVLTATLALVAGLIGAAAQTAAAALQGRWVVIAGEHNGRPMDSLNGGVMSISGATFEIRTASGTVLQGTLRLDASRTPAHMDLVHADGTAWEAVYEAAGNTLRLNYVVKGEKDPRPASFTTSAATEESLVVLRREAK